LHGKELKEVLHGRQEEEKEDGLRVLLNMCARWMFAVVMLLLAAPLVLGHEAPVPHVEYDDGKEAQVLSRAFTIMIIAGLIVVVCTALAMIFHERRGPRTNWLLFLGIALPTIFATAFSAGSTIYLNVQSETRGPVHWHADFEIWVCGRHVDLKSPAGLANRIGTSTLHEHGDNRIHVEGVLHTRRGAELGRFFHVVGGLMSPTTLAVPTDEGLVEATNGDLCPDGQPGRIQVFRHTVRNGRIVQEKLARPSQYVLAPYSLVPPGDCLIIEFGPERPYTDRLCMSYRAAIARGSAELRSAGLSSHAQRGELHGG
jgi:hypothetical protein